MSSGVFSPSNVSRNVAAPSSLSRAASAMVAVRMRGGMASAPLLSQDLLHRPAFRQLIHQLVHVPDVAHQRVLDLLDPDAADDAGDLADIRMQRRRFGEEGLEVLLLFDLLRERARTV